MMINGKRRANVDSILNAKLTTFAVVLNSALLAALVRDGVDCETNRRNQTVSVKIGGKYARVDVGSADGEIYSGCSGKYMVELSTGAIFGIKGYGQVHRGHQFGTLDTLADWDWAHYNAEPWAPIDRGLPVLCNGYPGRVVSVLSNGMIEVRLASGVVCVGISDIKRYS